MLDDLIDGKWKDLRYRIWERWEKSGFVPPVPLKNKDEQVIGLLQQRYGYTREKAASELKEHYSKIII
jgi:hypothetical protein